MAIFTKSEHPSEIQKFYSGKTIFLTGATGFLGKCLIEKIWRTCTDVGGIYVMIRPKKGKDLNERLDEMLKSPLFEKVFKQSPEFRDKLHVISGDADVSGLGLSDEDRKTIIKNVNIVIHGAATVRFDENLKTAIDVNVRATYDVIKLCRQIESLVSFIYISTAFSQCIRRDINEVFYDVPVSPLSAIKLVDMFDRNMLDNLTKGLLGEWPNTYAFTKALAEELVRQESEGLPAVVFRPSIVIGAYKEPIQGWIDVYYGPVGLIVGLGFGLIHTLHVDVNKNTDMVPVDMVTNSLLCSAWHSSKDGALTKPKVYNFVSGPQNAVNWGIFQKGLLHSNSQIPVDSASYYPCVVLTKNYYIFLIFDFLFHYIPAVIATRLLRLRGSKLDVVRIYKKGHKLMSMLRYFMVGERFNFDNSNVQHMWEQLSTADKELFPFDVRVIDWVELIYRFCLGVRRYVVKLPDSTIELAQKRHNRLKIIHFTLKYIILVGLTYLFLNMMYRIATYVLSS